MTRQVALSRFVGLDKPLVVQVTETNGKRQNIGRHRLHRKPLVRGPDMHHGTCVTYVTWCRDVEIANPRWRGKHSRHARRMRNPKFYVSGKRPIDEIGTMNTQWIKRSTFYRRHFQLLIICMALYILTQFFADLKVMTWHEIDKWKTTLHGA